MDNKIIILGDVRSKKNSKQITYNPATGKRSIVSSEAFTVWETAALWQLKKSKSVRTYPIRVIMTFYAGTARKFDLDNVAASVLDVLKIGGIIIDDSIAYVPELILGFGGIDRNNPRVEIELTKMIV